MADVAKPLPHVEAHLAQAYQTELHCGPFDYGDRAGVSPEASPA